MKPYQEMLGKSIEMVLKNTDITLEGILIEVLESVMEVERTTFLKYERGDRPVEDNKRNGYYERMIQNMRGRFRLQIPRDRQGLFQPFILELVKQDGQRMNDLALKLYSQGVSQRVIPQQRPLYFLRRYREWWWLAYFYRSQNGMKAVLLGGSPF